MSNLTPDYTAKNVTKIPEDILKGKTVILFDIDNTLFFPESTTTKPEIINWFKEIKKKRKCYCISNSNTIEERKESIENILKCKVYISKHRKPSKALVKEVQKILELIPEQTVVIGDMRFTDILFGNRLGAATILVEPLANEKLIRIAIARWFENLLVKF